MKRHTLPLAALALLLAGCASLSAQRPTPTATVDAATIEGVAGQNNTAAESVEGSLVVTESADVGAEQPETNGSAPAVTNTPLVTVGSATEAITTEITQTEDAATSAAQPAQSEAQASPTTNAATTTAANTPAAIAATQAQVAVGAYDNPASPVDLLASYYNAINLQDYERAYNYWQEPPSDYDSFAGGYSDTASVQLIVQPPTRIEGAAGSLYAEVPAFLVAQHHDGSVHSFGGCIVTRRSNLQPPDTDEAGGWYIYQARLTEVDNNASIPALLASACAS